MQDMTDLASRVIRAARAWAEAEAYRLEFLEGGDVRRAVTLAQASYLYTRADRLSDFGAAPSSLTLRLSQLSAAYGAGASTEVTLDV